MVHLTFPFSISLLETLLLQKFLLATFGSNSDIQYINRTTTEVISRTPPVYTCNLIRFQLNNCPHYSILAVVNWNGEAPTHLMHCLYLVSEPRPAMHNDIFNVFQYICSPKGWFSTKMKQEMFTHVSYPINEPITHILCMCITHDLCCLILNWPIRL